MLKSQIVVGGVYVAKVSGNLVQVRVDAIRNRFMGGPMGKDRTCYDVTNLKTGRKVTFRSAQKFRAPAATKANRTPQQNVVVQSYFGDSGPDPLRPETPAEITQAGSEEVPQ